MSDRRITVVTAAVIERNAAYLVTRRPAGAHLEGCWEFPGGKCDSGESLEECLAREIAEELDCGVQVGQEVFSVSHDYADRTVELHFFACTLDGEPRAVLGQDMQWAKREDLRTLEFPPADEELIRLLERKE
jgi:8-oxo-dGTP diphosphatase